MCGIVGYIGMEDSKELLLKGLEKLEYRGYDSAGVAIGNDRGIHVFKEKGRIAELRRIVDPTIMGFAGIGHTRWATHGAPSKMNAHPHESSSGRFVIVHNGVIENFEQLKENYLAHHKFHSETDSEVIVYLMEHFSNKGLEDIEAFRQTIKCLNGSYAIAIMDAQNPDIIYAAKNKSPLLIGLGNECNVVASDAMAMLHVTNQFVELHDKEMALLSDHNFSIQNLEGTIIVRKPFVTELEEEDIEKGIFPHFMLKEMNEQPIIIRKIIETYRDDRGNVSMDEQLLQTILQADRIHMIASGTSYHAALIGKQLIEKIAGIPAEVHIASEFAYNVPLLSEAPMFFLLSQSGETADTRAALVKIRQLGHQTLTITNVFGSTLSREADFTLYMYAGPEISVASTKAYTAQLATLLLLATALAYSQGKQIPFDPVQELSIAANNMDYLMESMEEMELIAREFLSETRSAFYIGRTLDYLVCLEGALKLKEISYIQAEGYAAGELKHGPIALMEEGIPVIALSTQEEVNPGIRGNMKEVMARGATVCVISMQGLEEKGDRYVIPRIHSLLTPFVSVMPMQMIAYYAALHRGLDVDKPRNLAKSVTVE
jgi:glucosamine--fructose-6-phosphate aminotransferase (isomerizing)